MYSLELNPHAGLTQVIYKTVDGKKYEPFEEATVEVPEDYVGTVVDLFGQRKGQMLDMSPGLGSTNILKYLVPTRGLLGLRSHLLTSSKGTAVLNTIFSDYQPHSGEMEVRENGSLVACETGPVTAYALDGLQSRGIMFIKPQDEVYIGQVICTSTELILCQVQFEGEKEPDMTLKVIVCQHYFSLVAPFSCTDFVYPNNSTI